ncbi:MAG TPA: hypothetical protein VGL58_20805 [Caulobacteraceae bacterium]|jgi:uridine kinase
MTCTIAICGTSGSGKTSLARAVADLLGDAAVLHFDDYEYPDPSTVSRDVEGWIAMGLPVAPHRGVTLAGEVAKLCAGESIQPPKGEGIISPTRFLVIEEPFGRARPAIAPLIDLVVFIATPADLALARRLRRDGTLHLGDRTSEEVLARLQSYLEWYLGAGHAFYERIADLAKLKADLIVDGRLPLGEIARSVADFANSAVKASA